MSVSDPRLAAIETFLAASGWADAICTPLAGDASARRYFRLRQATRTAVLMDADPARGERVGPFLAVGGWLRSKALSAPEVFAADEANGFLLLEDFGDGLFARLVAEDPGREADLYRLATDLLADLHDHPPPAFVARAGGRELGELVRLLGDYYLPVAGSDPAGAGRIADMIEALYGRLNDQTSVLSLRDFHAENLVLLPDRTGVARAGLLDFQDAFATHPAYDLVSLLQDARHDVSPATETACCAAYVARKGLDQNRFSAVYALLGAQRALRILAVFARLARRDGKTRYLGYMDRVWRYLLRNLDHPELAELRVTIASALPAPDDRLRACLSAPRPEALMLFAAGLGTRMRPLTDHLPKPLIKVAGRALIDHALEQTSGIGRVVVNIHYHADRMRAHLAGRPGLLFSDESERLLETGGGLKRALPLLASDPVLVLNTDAVWTGPAAQETLVRHWDPARMDALLLLVPRERALGHSGAGDFLLGDDGRLTRGAGYVYTGAQVIRTGPIAARPEEAFSLNLVWDRVAAEGRLFGVLHPGGWCDVGRPETILLAEAMLRDV